MADDVFKDVTSTYLTNADFEGEYEETTNPGKASGNKIAKPNGWTLSFTGASSDGTDCVGMNSSYAAWSTITSGETLPTNGGNNTYWVRMKWGNSSTLKLYQSVTLPFGTYALTSDYYKNGLGGDGNIYANSVEAKTSTNENVWKTVSLSFTSDGSASTEIGLKVVHTASASDKKLAFDNFKLEWNLTQSLASLITSATTAYEAGGSSDSALKAAIDDATSKKESTDAEELEEAYNALKSASELTLNRQAWNSAKSAAEDAIADDTYSSVTGEEKSALQAEIDKAEPTTAEGYDNAKLALENATSAFTAAKSSYDALVAAKDSETPELLYAATAKKTALTNAKSVTATSAADAEEKIAAITSALRAYYESNAMGEAYASALNLTSKLTNATNPTNTNGWTINNTFGNSGMRIKSDEPYTNSDGTTASGYFDSNSWNKAFTTKFTQNVELEAGKYIFTVKSRGNGINVYRVIAGEEYTDMPISASTGGVFGKGWNDYTVEFELDAKTSVALGVYMESGSSSNWLSFGDFRLVRLELYTEKATASDYEAMASALASAKAKALGFDVNEYAPYNNVEAITAIADAEAVNIEIDNPKADIEAITSALGNWTANEAEVNAFYDGTFSTREVQETSANGTKIPGWTSGDNIRQILKTEATFPGLADATAKTALFAWSGGAKYGEDAGYEMPLNANTIYKLNVKVAGWNNETRGDINVSVLNGEDGMAATVIGKADKDIKGNATNEAGMTSLEVFFVTGAAGNYVFSISSANNIVFSDVELKKVASQTLVLSSATKYAKGTYPTVTLDRTFSADKWNTLCVPFAFEKSSFEAVKVLSSVAEAGEDVSMKFVDAEGTVAAGTPCLVKNGSLTVENVDLDPAATAGKSEATVGNTTVTYQGTYAGTTLTDANSNAWVVSNNDLYHVNSNVTVGAFRAYFTVVTSGEVKSLSFDFGGETAIQGVEADGMSRAAIFNLAGQRVKNAQKGIYIVNGKKVLVK